MPTLSNEELKLAILKLVIKNSSYMTGSNARDVETVENIMSLFATQNTALLKELLEQQELVIEHSADFNDMKQYYAVPVPVINSKLAAMGEQ